MVLETEINRRLPWLLVFRAVVATALLGSTLAADLSDSPLRLIAPLLYGVAVATYVVILVLGALLRSGVSPTILSAAHLATAVMAAVAVVHGTGGIESVLSFLYLLVILDGAIIGGRRVALIVASASSLAYEGQLALQLYDVVPVPAAGRAPPGAYITASVAHVAAFFLVALLAGYLADLLRRAGEVASSAQTTLRLIEELHGSVVAALPVGVLTHDGRGVVFSANAIAAAILGHGDGGLEGQQLPAALLEGGASGRVSYDLEVRGSRRHLSVTRAALSAAAPGEEPLSVMVLEDRTELRALERDLSAKERLASLGELAAAIAHEIRNPLAAISGSVELLGSEPIEGTTRRRLQEIVLREIDRLNQLVGDFLAYARPTPPRRSEVQVRAMLEELREVLARDPALGHCTVSLDCAPGLVAWVDARQLRQLLGNLLRNAIEASGESGTVEVVAAPQAEDLVVLVIDEGEGIAEEVRPHLFEPFRTTRRSSTGLGLAVVHRIVEAHGGRIDVESLPGKGTTMRVVLAGALPAAGAAAFVAATGRGIA